LIYTTKKIERVFSDNQFKLQEVQTHFRCFQECFAMVQVMLSLWSLFIEFLGSYSRCRVSNGVMPRVLGPTNFYLKFWVNILTIRMLLCSSDEHQNVAVFFIRMLMFIRIFIWFHHWFIDEFLGLFNAWHMLFWVIPSKSNFSICIKKLLDKVG